MTIIDIYRAFALAVENAPLVLEAQNLRPNTFATVNFASELQSNNGGKTQVDAEAGTFFSRPYAESGYEGAELTLAHPLVLMEVTQGSGTMSQYRLSFSMSVLDVILPYDATSQTAPRTVDQIVADCIQIGYNTLSVARQTTINGVPLDRYIPAFTAVSVTPLTGGTVQRHVGASFRFEVPLMAPCADYSAPAQVDPPSYPPCCREIEIRNNGTYIQYRYVGEVDWIDLVALADITGPQGPQGEPGENATVAVGTVQTVPYGDPATVTNVGTPSSVILNFEIPAGPQGNQGDPGPQGQQGDPGEAATIEIGSVTTVPYGDPATVVNVGTPTNATFDFEIPEGAPGTPGTPGTAATIAVGTTTTGAPGTNASVNNSGTSSAAVFDFTIPRGDTGAQGPQGIPGPTVPLCDILTVGNTACLDINMNGNDLTNVGSIDFDTTPANAGAVARMQWNDTDGTLDLGLKGGAVTLQVGLEQLARVVNKTGGNLTQAGYAVVRVDDAQGQRLAVAYAQANSATNAKGTLGVVTETIATNQEGFICLTGQVRDINTTGSLQGETWADGDQLWLSATVPGGLTNVRPTAPNFKVAIGYVEYAHQNHGKIFVRVGEAIGFDDLHNMNQTNAETAGQVMTWQAAGYGQFVTPPYPTAFKNGVPQSVTGTTAQTILQSYLIPANTFAVGDIVEATIRFTKVGTAGGMAIRLAVNSSLSLVGMTTIYNISLTSAVLWYQFLRHLFVLNQTSQTQVLNTALSAVTDIATANGAATVLSLDWTQPQYIFTTIALGSALDTGQSQFILLKKN